MAAELADQEAPLGTARTINALFCFIFLYILIFITRKRIKKVAGTCTWFQFFLRQEELWKRLEKLGKPNMLGVYNGTSTLAELQSVLREAEVCFELYEQFDTFSVVPDGIHTMLEERRLAGLSVLNPPSATKVDAWDQLKIARHFLAQAYDKLDAFDQSIPLYRLLVDQVLKMREETWELKNTFHEMVYFLAQSYAQNDQFVEAKKWFERDLVFCEREAPESETHKAIKERLAKMTAIKAGPPTSRSINCDDGGAGGCNSWKKCWSCGAEGSPDKKLLRCSKCYTLELATPAYYCSEECQQQDWDRHKLYHKELKKNESSWGDIETVGAQYYNPQNQREISELLHQANHAVTQEGNLKKARRRLEKAIKLDPECAMAHYNLGNVFELNRNIQDMIREHEEVMRLTENNESLQGMWASAVTSVFFACRGYGSASAALIENIPAWVSDPRKLQSLAQRACRCDPKSDTAWCMLGAACEDLGEMEDAHQHYRSAGELAETQNLKNLYGGHAKRARQLQDTTRS